MIRLSVLLFCITSLVSSLAVHADDKAVILLVKSTDAFIEGQLLDDSKDINLPFGAKVIVAFGNGDTQTLEGPYYGKLKAPVSDYVDLEAQDLVTKLVDFRKEPPTRGTTQSDTDWSRVNVNTSARYHCVAPSSVGVVLWRPDSISASDVIIKHKATRKAVIVKWPAYQSTLKWPEDKLPLIYGDIYTVKIKNRTGSSSFKKLILYQLPDRLPTKSHKVVWMVGRGCIPQANILLASLR
ncbi:MAG: hypothetical protein DRR16_26280 [Candidatus Parabeggiatoa sp. nov. 3]|nr:MAG: hypothetical protein DRR00_17805 [Gammaproteobacteria bacterium]RKZ65958.1 MAG: hypothetical protein DRQ99_11145 [Gammaproteobacteria bacterium]RKZ79154.1 MAG: hypothetical protein DRR16_26280 [Gammaproteobacteria bacterium]